MRLLACALWLAAIPALTAAPVFTLYPADGALGGWPGRTLTWGLDIQNDNSGWLVINSVTYDQTVSIGDFVELLTPQFLSYALGPNATWPPLAGSPALGTYVIDGSFAMPGDMATGFLHLLYEIHSIDPNGPGYDQFNDTINGYEEILPATVTYDAVPEPATAAMMLLGVALCAFALKTPRARSMKG